MYRKFLTFAFVITMAFCSLHTQIYANTGELKVTLIIPTTQRDRSWSQSMYEALYNLKDGPGEMPVLQISVEKKVSHIDNLQNIIKRASKNGVNFVVAHSPTYKWKILDIAPKYPDVFFAVTADKQEIDPYKIPTNVFIYAAAEGEAGYLNGVIAALALDFATVGMVVPETGPTSIVNNYIEGFRNGLLTTSPASSTRVNYVHSPWNTHFSSEAASLLVLNDAEILSGIFPQAIGALHVAEINDIPWIGIECNQRAIAPNNVLASQVYHWEVILTDMILNPFDKKELYTINLANGGIKTNYNRAALKDLEEIKEVVDKVVAGIIEGYIDPLSDEFAID